ncbi:MAG: class II fructose-bisphosphate aldolase [Candidatus Diapherotrites archaeon]|nr:class II fructose-bisphosphate aldolase [Candidatus Diapherotrites archaeon]
MAKFDPLPGNYLFDCFIDDECIIMACNTRTTVGVAKGIFRAAKDLDAPMMMELAKSECDLNGGYTGFTPQKYSEAVRTIAKQVKYDVWALHADHITVKKGDNEEIEKIKKLIDAQIKAGYTSFAIDASFLFDDKVNSVAEQLKRNIEVTTELAKYIEENMKGKSFGLEVEVGEIGKKDEHGRVLTTPEEATYFIKKLNENGVYPQGLAIANGSAHGNTYDAEGNLVPQLSIDIPQTVRVGEAVRKVAKVGIVQHGITGTPLDLIATKFPKKYIVKGNVGTNWQNLFYDVVKVYQPDLYKEIKEWVHQNYDEEAKKKNIKSEEEFLGKYIKNAFKPFFEKVNSLEKDTVKAIEDICYANSLLFFKAFSAIGKASVVREKYKI